MGKIGEQKGEAILGNFHVIKPYWDIAIKECLIRYKFNYIMSPSYVIPFQKL